MKASPPPRNTNEEGLLSCWGHLKLKLPWRNRRQRNNNGGKNTQANMCCDVTAVFTPRQPRPFEGFRYDPLSYAQNFDDGVGDDDDEDSVRRGFSTRYVASAPRSVAEK
ncbi:hypothetical protein SLEP1_g42034 [Rubroshorea leprosula]|uniref:Uncharacterized protein n=1 Tax=Rubroshorea leprosula TaxID=152421 RepID=A0AAV5L8G0_9ROSI|nr:hypothetical protein SLEP1_g42034 [Rubroshorea leprosula]